MRSESCNASEPFSPAACGGSTPGTSARAKRPLIGNARVNEGRAWITSCGIVLAWLLVCAAACQQRPADSANVTAGSRKKEPAKPSDGAGGPATAKSEPPKAPAEKPEPKEAPSPKPPALKNPLAGCQQCHVDIEDEYAPSLHFQEKVACTECHGPSTGHLADENNEVKPDELFGRKDVDRLCERCHECSRPAEPKRIPKSSPEYKVCTDCHGPHDLKPATKQSPPKPAK